MTGNCFVGKKEDAQKMIETFLEKGTYVKIIYSEISEYFAGDIIYIAKTYITNIAVRDSFITVYVYEQYRHFDETFANLKLDDKGNLIINIDEKL